MTTGKAFRFGDFVLDCAGGRLLGAAGPVKIGNKAFAVLRALAERPGHLLVKAELLEAGWPGLLVTDAALTSVVKELRRALADDPRRPRYIETVYGRGYRFLPAVAVGEGPVPVAAPPRTMAAMPRPRWSDRLARLWGSGRTG